MSRHGVYNHVIREVYELCGIDIHLTVFPIGQHVHFQLQVNKWLKWMDAMHV